MPHSAPAARPPHAPQTDEAPTRRGTFELTTRAFIPAPVDEVFAFFGDAHNLNTLTPPGLRFRILTPTPIAMQPGTLIDYRIQMRGVPLLWRTWIAQWEPPHRFVDEQLRGPYLEWVHTHTFEPREQGTLMMDHVRYRVPGGALVNRLFVERELRTIFRYRLEAFRRVFTCEPTTLDRDVAFRKLA